MSCYNGLGREHRYPIYCKRLLLPVHGIGYKRPGMDSVVSDVPKKATAFDLSRILTSCAIIN